MPNTIDDVSEFTEPVTSPSTGEPANQGTFAAGIQALANRTRWLFDNLGGLTTLAVNTVLGRRSTGVTGGQPVTDFSFDLLALPTSIAHADALHVRGTAIASASTTNIAGATGTFVHVTGTTPINAFGTAPAGATRIVTFDSPLTINHNPTAIILPGGLPLSVLGGESVLVVSEGAGIWRLIAARSGGVYADTIHRFIAADGNDANDGLTEATPWATFARCNAELARYSMLANFALHGVGSGVFAIDTTLNAIAVGRLVLIGRFFTTVVAELTLAAGTNAIHLRLTDEPGEDTDDLICRVTSGAALGQMRLVQGWRPRRPVRFAATSDIALTGVQTPDGASSTADGDRILTLNNTDPLERLIWIARDAGPWELAPDCKLRSELQSASVVVEEGDDNAGKTFYQLTADVDPEADEPEWSETPSALELSFPFATSPAAADTIELLRPAFEMDAAAIFETPGTAIVCPGAVWTANIDVSSGELIASCQSVAKWATFGEVYGCVRDFTAFIPESSGSQLYETAVFGETWLSSPEVVLGCGTVCQFPAYRAIGNYHCKFLSGDVVEDTAITLSSGVLRGNAGVAIQARLGAIAVIAEHAIPFHGVVNHRGGKFRATSHETNLGIVWCGTITAALIQSHIGGDCSVTGGHAGFGKYAFDAEPGGHIGINYGNFPLAMLGELGDCHVRSITVPNAVINGPNCGIGDFRAPYATGGRIYTTSFAGSDEPIDSYAPTSDAATVTLTPATRAMMIDNRAVDVVVQMADPAFTLEPCDLLILGSTDDHPVVLRPMHGEAINEKDPGDDLDVVASPYSALRVHCDRVKYFVSGNRVLTS